MTTRTLQDRVTTIRQDNKVITQIEIIKVEPTDQKRVLETTRQIAELLTEQIGFVSINLHRSLDATHVVNYLQWSNLASLEAAQLLVNAHPGISDIRNLLKEVHTDIYDVTHTLDLTEQGVTTISTDFKGATFINVISTSPQSQGQLLDFVVGNDIKGFSTAPGYRSANFHRGHKGDRVINYSQWDNSEAFMRAIERLLGKPNLTVEEANQAATKGAGGIGQTDFRFYEVVASFHS